MLSSHVPVLVPVSRTGTGTWVSFDNVRTETFPEHGTWKWERGPCSRSAVPRLLRVSPIVPPQLAHRNPCQQFSYVEE